MSNPIVKAIREDVESYISPEEMHQRREKEKEHFHPAAKPVKRTSHPILERRAEFEETRRQVEEILKRRDEDDKKNAN